MKDAILVIDFGTSNCRAIAFDAKNGTAIESCSRKYAISSPKPGYSELDPEELWRFSVECVREVVRSLEDVRICAINFSFIGTSLICVDERFKPTYPCILCFDSRAVSEAEEMAKRFATQTFHFSKWASAAKIKHIKNTMPEVYEKTRYFWSIQQFILARLGLEPAWDPTIANLQYLYSPANKTWDQDILDDTGITVEQLSGKVLASDGIAGLVSKFGDVDLGVKVPVLVGAHDGAIGIIGLGIMDESEDVLGESAGTFDHIGFLANIDPDRPMTAKWAPGPLENTFVRMYGFPTYGADVEWFMREIVGSSDRDAYADMETNNVFDGAPGPVFVNPSFSGNGMFSGLSLSVTRHDLFKAMLEALTFETRRGMEQALASKQGGCTRIRIGGGPARSDVWTQLRADVTGMKIERLVNHDSSALGAAIMAAAAVGLYPNLRAAVDQMIVIKDVFEPDAKRQAAYNERYREYLERIPTHS